MPTWKEGVIPLHYTRIGGTGEYYTQTFAILTGLEPAASTVTGWRALQLLHRTIDEGGPLPGSSPGSARHTDECQTGLEPATSTLAKWRAASYTSSTLTGYTASRGDQVTTLIPSSGRLVDPLSWNGESNPGNIHTKDAHYHYAIPALRRLTMLLAILWHPELRHYLLTFRSPGRNGNKSASLGAPTPDRTVVFTLQE